MIISPRRKQIHKKFGRQSSAIKMFGRNRRKQQKRKQFLNKKQKVLDKSRLYEFRVASEAA